MTDTTLKAQYKALREKHEILKASGARLPKSLLKNLDDMAVLLADADPTDEGPAVDESDLGGITSEGEMEPVQEAPVPDQSPEDETSPVQMPPALRKKFGDDAADFLDEFGSQIHAQVRDFFDVIDKLLDIKGSNGDLKEMALKEIGTRGLTKIVEHLPIYRAALVKLILKDITDMFPPPMEKEEAPVETAPPAPVPVAASTLDFIPATQKTVVPMPELPPMAPSTPGLTPIVPNPGVQEMDDLIAKLGLGTVVPSTPVKTASVSKPAPVAQPLDLGDIKLKFELPTSYTSVVTKRSNQC